MHVNWCQSNPAEQQQAQTSKDYPRVQTKPVSKDDIIIREVKGVLKQLVSDVLTGENKTKPSQKDSRRSFSNLEKVRALDELEKGMLAIDVASKYDVNRSMITRWKNNADVIYNAFAGDRKKQLFAKNRKGGKHTKLLLTLFEKFKSARSQGKRCSHVWIYIQASKLFKEMYPHSTKPLSKSIVAHFTSKYNIKCLRVQRRKQKDNKEIVPSLMKWHSDLREGLIKTGSDKAGYDQKWGRFTPSKRLNVDQVPLPFAINVTRTYEVPIPKEERRNHRVWVNQPGSGLDKRQCTLQLAFGPETVIRPTLIFRGLGKRISKDEKMAYDKDVDVMFQANAWADTKVCEEWVKLTLSSAVQNLDEYILFCDNLVGQTSEEFQKAVRKTGGIVWYGLANATNIWQPVDCGYGQMYKAQMALAQERWLEEGDNIERWVGNQDRSFTASDRRILLTHWVGEAHRIIAKPIFDSVRLRCFQKTGCLITADGSDDEKIKPEGLEACYIVPPPLSITLPTEQVQLKVIKKTRPD